MTEPTLGIDIAKLKFNVCLIRTSGKLKHKVFPNHKAGFEQLLAWLSKQKVEPVHACLEATGIYSEPLALYLHEAGHVVSLINPAAIKAFAGSRLSRTKTDRVDAELIARFCLAREPPRWTPLATEVQELQGLVRRLESLIEMRVMEENRLSSGGVVDTVRRSLEEHLAYLSQEIKRTEELIRKHINSHPGLKQQTQLLDSIPGIAETTAALSSLRDDRYQAVQKRPPGSGLCRASAKRASIGHQCQRARPVIKDRECSTQMCALHSGHHSPQMQPVHPSMGQGLASAR